VKGERGRLILESAHCPIVGQECRALEEGAAPRKGVGRRKLCVRGRGMRMENARWHLVGVDDRWTRSRMRWGGGRSRLSK
jgi:hypothetical protein